MALRSVRQSNGDYLVRDDKKELDADIVQAAKDSLVSGTAMDLIFDTEKEAKATATKLRSYENSQGHGLRATVREIEDGWVLQFKVSPTKRDVSAKE